MKYSEYMYTKIHWGKHKGKFLKDVPDDYIVWAIQNIEDTGIATMFGIEYCRRHKQIRGTNK
jgi:uncharacterized protein (DUF3820 family)